MDIEKPLLPVLSANNCGINSEVDQESLQIKNKNSAEDDQSFQTNQDLQYQGEQKNEIQNQSISNCSNDFDNKKTKYQKYAVLVLINLSFLLLSLSLHLERLNHLYSESIRYNYVLVGLSSAIVLIFNILVWYIPKKRVCLILSSLVLSVFAQVFLITFFQSLTSENHYKEAFVCSAYFITGSITFYGFSFLFPQIEKKNVHLAIAFSLIIALIILIFLLSTFWIIISATIGGIYISVFISQFEEKLEFQSYRESILFTLKMWIILIPLAIATMIYILYKIS
ncbi:transmembrane protein, putative (macronuclear) [Tetrahymena thermophila SB210]|uniref:Transmembrane protein, putative n=1 Tax=Tetrahymena thermophila (strain SB210) TaxID=312017 RepID=W7X418_TETTS|nr:transmembrane protein, putative [Tetrahymena thermophila SB210]EWS71168.1 transmembrane protein, putative [Tetrahymena thermophila SB210]|eukprot:XP_012656309.1 transmembrane protein, putative [Tetrahymena thermophila SB210]